MPRFRKWIASCTTLVLIGTGVAMATPAYADNPAMADTVFNAWNSSFLYRNGTDTYYTDELLSKGNERAGTWIGGLDIAVAEDVNQRAHTPADQQLVGSLVTTFLKYDKTNWTDYDSWNDDIAWMGLAVLRGYQDTGNASWLTTAATQWNNAYNRGWSTDGGGGIWEEQNSKYSKCALSNDPMVTYALGLYQITGDSSYLTKAEAIYAWVRSHLFHTDTGQVDGCIAFPNGPSGATTLQASDNAYDAGSWIEAANYLYRITGNQQYDNDALLSANHIMNTQPIVSNTSERGSSYQYRYFRGLSEFCTDNGNCATYATYMQNNANQAWSERNSANLTWNDWTSKTNDSNPDAFEMNGMVALWQQLPITSPSPFSGNYQLQNVASKLDVTVQGASTANSAPVVQTADAGDSSSWTLVPESNGYYEIKNVHSGQILNVTGVSSALGATIVQWPPSSIRPGNDQWYPVHNADGTWSFYNRNSQLALDNPAASTASGTQYQQYAQNNTASQEFNLIPRSGSSGAVRSGITGKCMDVNGGNNANGTTAQLWDCNGTPAQNWTATSSGQLQAVGKCLDATALGTANGTKLEIWDCNGGANQIWNPYNGGYRNPTSGRCIDDPAATSTNGTQLQIYDCNGSPAQHWTLPS